MRATRARVLQAGASFLFLFMLAFPLMAQDVLRIGGTTRKGIANQTITVPVVIQDIAGTPAGAELAVASQTRYFAFEATFNNDALVQACSPFGTGNCNYVEAGIAPTLNLVPNVAPNYDPCGAKDLAPDTPCFYQEITGKVAPNTISYLVAFQHPVVTNQAAPRGDLIGYFKLKLAPTFPAGGTVTISLTPSLAHVSGYDIYSNDGNPSSAETVANTFLALSSFQPADANNNTTLEIADLTQASTDLEAAPGAPVTGTNFHSDCDADGKLTGADVLCVYNELNPSTVAQRDLLDVDADGTVSALSDGLLILRRLFSFAGLALTTGAVGPLAQRTDPVAIAAYIDAIKPALDLDKNGSVLPLSDALMILRGVFGFTDAAMTTGAIGTGATRTTAEIQAYYTGLRTRLP